MTPLIQGLVSGVAFGALSVGLMIPLMTQMKFENPRAAMLGAFINRFGIGLVIPLLNVSQSGSVLGGAVGLLLSLPSAIITKAYVPIIVVGTIGGIVIGGLTRGWV